MNSFKALSKNYSRHLLQALACVLLVSAASSFALQTPAKPEPVFDPAKPTTIAWDLHHVLVTTTPSNSWQTFVNYPQKWDAVKNPLLLLKTTILVWRWAYGKASERLWNKMFGPSPEGNAEIVSVEEFVRAGEYYDNSAYAQLVKAIINAQMPMPGMSQLLQDLKNTNRDPEIQMHIASNIGTLIFEDLKTNTAHKDVQEQILKYIDLEKSHAVTFYPNKENRTAIIKKPNIKFFQQYLANAQLDPQSRNVIFIDNSQKNVDAAKQAGMIGILFKNTDQIRTELEAKGLLNPRSAVQPPQTPIPLEQKTIYSE